MGRNERIQTNSIQTVLLASLLSVWISTNHVPFKNNKFDKKTIAILGLRGGISIALALSIDESLNKNILVIT